MTTVIKSVGISDYSKVPADILRSKSELGSWVHEATELDDRRELDENSITTEIAPYLSAWRKFKHDFKPDFQCVESRFASLKYGFAGTIDRNVSIKKSLVLIDIKTSLEEAWHRIQLAAYLMLLKENEIRPEKSFNVYLQNDGNYKTSEELKPSQLKESESIFMHALNVHKWKISNSRKVLK